MTGMDTETGPTPDDLRASVRDFRDPRTSALERKGIDEWWAMFDIPNQFAAMLRASGVERARGGEDQ